MSASLGFGCGRPHREGNLLVRALAKRRLAAPELHEQHRDGEDVGGGRELLAFHLFGRHVTRRPEDAVTARRRGHGGRDAEVDDLDLPLLVDHHVARRHVPVHHVHAAVRVVERPAHLDADVRSLLRRQGARRLARTGARAKELREARALDVLHRQEIGPELHAELVDGHDVRMREGDRRLRLFDEPAYELLVARELFAHLLDDELLLEASRAPQRRQDDPRHAAARELALEHVLAEDLGVHWQSGPQPRFPS